MKRLFLASLAVAAMLASCTKESTLDTALTQPKGISFAPYAGASSTRGAAVDTNSEFCQTGSTNNSFMVSAYNGSTQYFGFDEITYDGTSAWSGTTQRYWPADALTLHFGAYYPEGAAGLGTVTAATDKTKAPAYSYSGTANSLSFGYTVQEAVGNQVDMMYAISDHTPAATDSKTDVEVGLHFKHALTQVGFTATKDAGINVTVSSIAICNVVDNGVFTAAKNTNNNGAITEDKESDDVALSDADCSWANATAGALTAAGATTNLNNFTAKMVFDSGETFKTVATTETQLTDADDVLMLLPQTLTKWDITSSHTYPASYTSTKGVAQGTDSYLAIECVITSTDNKEIANGTIYMPFDTTGIKYDGSSAEDGWKAGYKLTYNLHFGGGYKIPDDGSSPKPEPKPGEVPDPDEVVKTLRTIKYKVTVDAWKVVADKVEVNL